MSTGFNGLGLTPRHMLGLLNPFEALAPQALEPVVPRANRHRFRGLPLVVRAVAQVAARVVVGQILNIIVVIGNGHVVDVAISLEESVGGRDPRARSAIVPLDDLAILVVS